MFQVPVQLVAALPAEADPLRERFGLTRRSDRTPFPLFENRNIRLIVSGEGKLAAAAATGYLLARPIEAESAIWLNVGIAGHGTLPIGEAFIASEIRDQASGRNWRPCFPATRVFPAVPLTTVDRPLNEYPPGRAVDMEGAGFFLAARRSVPEELAHCVKIVSDNGIFGTDRINGEMVTDLIAGQLDGVIETIHRLADVALRLPQCRTSPALLARYAERVSLTRSDRQRLSLLLSRWKLLDPSSDLWLEAFTGLRDGKDLLQRIDRHLTGLYPGTGELDTGALPESKA